MRDCLYVFGWRPFPRGSPISRVYIDDIGAVEICHADDPSLKSHSTPGAELFTAVEQSVEDLGMKVHAKKGVRREHSGRMWGVWLEGLVGWRGPSLDRRYGTSLCLLAIVGQGTVRKQLEEGIGMVSCCFLYLRTLFAVLDIAYLATRKFPTFTRTHPRGPLREELITSALLVFFAESDLRSELFD